LPTRSLLLVPPLTLALSPLRGEGIRSRGHFERSGDKEAALVSMRQPDKQRGSSDSERLENAQRRLPLPSTGERAGVRGAEHPAPTMRVSLLQEFWDPLQPHQATAIGSNF
jgi:hypothetical protein